MALRISAQLAYHLLSSIINEQSLPATSQAIHPSTSTFDYEQLFIIYKQLSFPSKKHCKPPFLLLPLTHRPAELRSIMGNLALHNAEEPDDPRATTGTVEVPTIRDNDAALALGARPSQQHERAARHRSQTENPSAI